MNLLNAKLRSTNQFWDINKLIYAIEYKLNDIKYPIQSLVTVYLAAGSDFTEKWFQKTHETFLKTYLKHKEFIGSLLDKENEIKD